MKQWRIDYRINYIDGTIAECVGIVKAHNIMAAVGAALVKYKEPTKWNPEISGVTITKAEVIE